MTLKHEPAWSKAAVTSSLRQGGKLPIACGFTSGTARSLKMAKQPDHPEHSSNSIQNSSTNKSDGQSTATLGVYSFPHLLLSTF